MMRYRATVLLLIAVLFGALAAYLVNQIVRNQPAQQAELPRSGRSTVISAMDLPPGTSLQRIHLRIVELPDGAFPSDSFTNVEDALQGNPSVVASITAGEVLLPARLSTGLVRKGLTARIPEGHRAVSIPVNAVRGVGGFVLPGDHVDVLHTSAVGRRDEQLVTRTLLEDVTVLGIDQQSAEDEEDPIVANVATLLATPEQAKKLTLAQHAGTLTLALRNSADIGKDASTTIALNNLWDYDPAEQPVATVAATQSIARRRSVEVIRGLVVDKETIAESNDAIASF